MGAHAGDIIANEIRRRGAERPAFVYNDKGSLAVIGNAKAVAAMGERNFGGFFAWVLWGVVHIAFLIGFRNRVQVLLSWFWNWLLNARDARLITGDVHVNVHTPRPSGFVRTSRE